MNYHLIADIRDIFTFQLKTQSAKTGVSWQFSRKENGALSLILVEGIPWWSSDEDSTLPLLGAQVLSLVRELRSSELQTAAYKIK